MRGLHIIYPLVKRFHNYRKSPFLMGKLTINGHFNSYVKLPEGIAVFFGPQKS